MKQLAHRDHRGPGGNEIVEDDYVSLSGRLFAKGEDSPDTMLRVTLGNVFVERDAEQVGQTSRKFKSRKAAEGEISDLRHQSELNSVEIGEQSASRAVDLLVLDEVKEAVGRRHRMPEEAVEDIYMKRFRGEELSGAEKEIADEVDAYLPELSEKYKHLLPENIRKDVAERYGVDVDGALRKPEKLRSEDEQAAVGDYLERLYGEVERQRRATEIWNAEAAQMDAETSEALRQERRRAWRMQMSGKLLGFDAELRADADRVYEESRNIYERHEQGDPTARAKMDAIALRMEEARQMCEDAFGAEAEYYMYHINENPWALINDAELTPDQQEAVLNYINSKAALDGVMDASNEAADRKRAEIEQSVGKRTHKDSGMVIPATMKVDDRQVYVVKGNVVMLPDGTAVDVRNSSESVVVMDAQTGEYEFTSPDQINKIGESINPQDELQAAYQQIDAEQMNIFGTVPKQIGAGEPEAPSRPIVYIGEYNRGYDYGLDVSKSLSDDVLNDAITNLRGQEFISDAWRGCLKAFEHEQQRRAMEAQGVPEKPESGPNTEGNGYGSEATPLQRLPHDANGEPMFEQAETPEHGWDALVESRGGNVVKAKVVADMMAENKRKELENLQKHKPKGKTASEIMKSQDEIEAALAQVEAEYNMWQQMAGVEQRRQDAIRAQQEEEARRLAAERAEEEARLKAEREEAERIEREALNGIPDWNVDAPADARARGYRRYGSQKVDRPDIIDNVALGNSVEVKFGDDVMPKGNIGIIEASQLQPSHRDGQRNPAHFLDEAQPKERTDAASRLAAQKIASAVRPEEITSSVTAYTGAPTVNNRGEVIQGNNRGEALRIMYERFPQSVDKYKQYLISHADDFGLTPEAIAAFEQPVLVNMLDVSDDDAITLGQYVSQDTESGGTERIKPKNAVQKMGEDMRTFANLLLRSSDEEATFAQLVDTNGVEVLNWMNQHGYISNTQYGSAFDGKGNLSAEAANDLKGIMYESIFTGGSTRLKEMFDKMPAKAQRAILATAFRDNESPKSERMIGEIQQSIIAFDALMGYEQFRAATNAEAAMNAVEAWKKQYAFDDVTGEPFLPSETFSNFALALVAMYKGNTQKHIQTVFNAMYDLVQGTGQDNLFETAEKTPQPIAEAIRRVLNIEYQPITKQKNDNGNDGSAVLANDSETGQAGRRGSDGDTDGAEQNPTGTEPSERGAGTAGDSRGSGDDSKRQDNIPKGIEVSSAERTEMESRIVDWLSDDNLVIAFGKSREEIFDIFGNELEPIAYVPARFIPLLGSSIKDARIYCGMGYFIDHALRNHGKHGHQIPVEDIDVSKYLNIQAVLDNPDAIKETIVDGKRTVVFIKKIGRFFAELAQVEEKGKIVLHKSLFDQKKEPYVKLNDIRQKDTSSEGGDSSISHEGQTSPAISLESRGDVESESKLQTAASKPHGLASERKGNNSASEKQGNGEESSAQVPDSGQGGEVANDGNYEFDDLDTSAIAERIDIADDDWTEGEGKTKFRLLEDDDPKAIELESLPDSELVPVYRNVQAFEDDALGSPMAFTDAETGERRTLQGQKWNYSNPPQIELTPEQQRQLDELNKNGYIVVDGKKTTELQINDGLKFVKPKTKDAQLQYFLKKSPEDKGLWAAYDPYDHAIETPLNTQFGEAYKRPNLVVVRSLIPKSEIDEPFHADYALLPTGAHQWNNGRTLYLSRWSKIDKVLTREEEAKLIDEYWKKHPGKREALKSHRDYNRFVPQVRRELEKMGYRFELDGKELTPEESLALDEQNMENRDVIPGREGHAPFMTNEDIARINAKMSGKWVGEPKEAMNNAMAERVNELAERLHTPVRIIRTDEEVAALPSARQRRMKGSFNPMTGEVTIVVPNNANMADVENTFIHEVVGHDGLRVLFPEEEKLNNALDELYRVSKDEIRNSIDRMAQKMYDAEVDRLREKKRKEHEANGEDSNASYYADMAEAHAEASKKREQFKRDATEEYGADLAGRIGEKGFEKMSAKELTFWGKLKSMLQKALQKLLDGLKIPGKKKWGDKEWAFVLHEAYKRKKNGGKPDVFDAADTEVMRRKTGFGETKFSDGHKKSAQLNEAALKHLEPTDVEHAAKVQQKREKAKESLANVAKTYKNTTDSKGFISDLSNSLGLTRGSTGSGYGSFETPNGNVFTIRVSNHNINAANVGDEPVESIVIKTKRSPNRFHAEDGKFANEYVYFKEDIRKAPAGTLSAIAESISDLLDTGEYHDKTGLAKDNHSPETDPDGGMKFRDGDMGLDETITQMKIAASQANADNLQAKRDAMRAIGGNLNHLRQAMARQREYDITTVKSVTDLAKILMDAGLLDDLSKYETKRILGAINDVVGKQDVSQYVQKVMDIMVDNQLRNGAGAFGKLLAIRGSRVDARGIEVQGELDPDGQRIAQVVRKSTSLPKDDIDNRIAEAINRMSSTDQATADEATLEYAGLQIARQYVEDITESKAEEKALRDSIKQAKEDKDAGQMTDDAYKQYVESTNDAIRQNKIERAEAYQSLIEQMGDALSASVERAKAWREAEKQRVEEIHHNANSDMEGRPTDEHHKDDRMQKMANNSFARFLLAPLGTFDQMLRMFGKKNVRGEGYLWNRYMRGWVEATEKEYTGYREALKVLDAKVSEIYGKKMTWGDLFAIDRKLPKASVRFWDGGEMKDHVLTQGNLLYIYMADKMSDGRMKLRRMGITEDDIENINRLP